MYSCNRSCKWLDKTAPGGSDQQLCAQDDSGKMLPEGQQLRKHGRWMVSHHAYQSNQASERGREREMCSFDRLSAGSLSGLKSGQPVAYDFMIIPKSTSYRKGLRQ